VVAVVRLRRPPTATPKVKPVIKLIARNWLSTELNDAVAKIILTEKMGYPVEIIKIVDEAEVTAFESLAKGETHVELEIWTSVYPKEVQKYIETEKSIENGGPLGVVGKIGWFIPTYIAKKYPQLATWEGLKDPQMVTLFSTPDTGDKGLFLSGAESWESHDADIIKNLGLNFKVKYADSEDTIIEAVSKAYDQQDPLLFYFWTPHWLFAKYELTEVKLPPYSKECYAKVKTGGLDCDYPPDVLIKGFWPGLKKYAPEAYQFFKNFRFTTDDQIVMLALVQVQKKSVEEAARFWMSQNEDKWQIWLPK